MADTGDEIVAAAAQPSASPLNPDLLAYDFFKHMTNLSVLTLGGMVTLFGSIFSRVGPGREMFLPMALIALSGLAAFLGQIEMVESAYRVTRKRVMMTRLYRVATPLFFGSGTGAFLSVVLERMP